MLRVQNRDNSLVLATLMILALVTSACNSKHKVEKIATEVSPKTQYRSQEKVSPEVETLLEEIKEKLSNPEHEQIQENRLDSDVHLPQITKEEMMINQSLNHTILELISLDPQKDGARVTQLLSDIKIFGKKALEVIQMMLTEDRPINEKMMLTYALGAVDDSSATDQLFEIVNSQDNKNIRSAAIESLSKSPQRKEYVHRATEMLYEVSDDIGQKSVEDQLNLIALLGASGAEDSIDALEDIINHSEEDQVRNAALTAIAQIGGDEAIDILFDQLKSNSTLSQSAAQSLGKIESEDVVIRLGQLIISENEESEDNEDDGGKEFAIQALGYNQSSPARMILMNLVTNKNISRELHQAAAKSLSQNLTDEEISPLVELMVNTKLDYIHNLISPLIAKGGDTAVSLLENNLDSAKEISKIHLIRTMGLIPGDKSLNVLSNYYFSRADEKVGIKSELLRAMANLKAPQSVSVLEKVVWESPELELRRLALKSMGHVLGKDSAPFAVRVLSLESDRELKLGAIELLRKFGSSDDKSLLLTLKMSDEEVEVEKHLDSAIAAIEAREN